MFDLREKEGVLRFRVRVQPKASRDEVVGEFRGALKVKVTAPPEKGKANAAVIALLAKALGVRKSAVTIESGGLSREKSVAIRGLSRADFMRCRG